MLKNPRYFLYSIALSLCLVCPSFAAETAKNTPVTLGVFPYVSPGQLVKFHNDLRVMLEKTLGRKVVLITAPSFKEFVQRTKKSTYDIIMTAPHLGRLAEVRDGYQPLAHTMHEVQGVYLVKKSSKIHNLSDLKGKTITLVGRSAIITQMAEKQLNEIGLQDGKNITFRITKTHNNAMFAPLRDESDASVTGTLLWRKIGDKYRDKVKVIGKTPLAIGFQVMASSQITERDFNLIQKALLDFHMTEQGKTYMEKTGFKKFERVDEAEKKALDPFIQIFLENKK